MSAGSTGPLSDRDLHALVSALGRGEQPRIAVTTDHAGIPAGSKGVLVGYDPDAELPATVRVSVDGDPRDVPVPTSVLAVVPRGRADVIARTAASTADAAGAGPGDGPGAEPAATRRGRTGKAPARKASRGGSEVVITVTVAGDGATVEASHGSRKLVKPTSVPVAVGHAVARAVDIEAVTDAVETVIDEHRSAKQAEAEQLRARLAELERELASYPGADDAAPEPAPTP